VNKKNWHDIYQIQDWKFCILVIFLNAKIIVDGHDGFLLLKTELDNLVKEFLSLSNERDKV
jgi:homoserine acetyltransferase